MHRQRRLPRCRDLANTPERMRTGATSLDARRLPVVVLAPGNYLAPLAVMRSLRPLGARVYAPATRRISLWKMSRYFAGTLDIGEDGSPSRSRPDATVEQLLDAGRALGGDVVLIPCSDEWAMFVARYADRLAQTFRFSHLRDGLAEQLGDKQQLLSLARERGVGVPDSVLPADHSDAVRLAPSLQYPVVIKTATTRSEGNQFAVVADEEELISNLDHMDDPGNLICQRLVPGGDGDGWLFNGYFDAQSRCIARFSGQKLRQWPARRGITVLAQSNRNPELEEIAAGFLSSIGYRGAVDLDFMRDPRDGTYNLLDVNPRLGGVFRLFEDEHGLDTARAMYLDLIGAKVMQVGQRQGRRIVVEGGYVVATLKLSRAGLITPWRVVREVHQAEMGTFRLTDPMPFMVHMTNTIRVHAGARLRRFQRSLGRARQVHPARRETPAA
jgi:D-aspartate ligase